MKKVSIIIPTTLDPTLTYECIDSINNFDMGYDYEIIVVDNGSNPKFEKDNVKIIREEKQLSFAKAMNIGIKENKNDYLLLLNNDTKIMHNNLLKNMVEVIESDEKIAIVSPTTNFICVQAAKSPDLKSIPNDILEYNHHVAAVCFLLKKEALDDIGLFDEQFINSHGDGDFCERTLRNGWKIFLDRRNFIYHYGSRSVTKTVGYYEAFQENSRKYQKKWNK